MMMHESIRRLAFEPCNTLIYIKCIGISGELWSLFLIILCTLILLPSDSLYIEVLYLI